MDIRILKTSEDFSRYDAWVKGHPQGNLWQSLEWKQYQEALGRKVRIYIWGRELVCPSPCPLPREEGILASALVVIDRTMGGFCTWDVMRGPLGDFRHQTLDISSEQTLGCLLDTIIDEAKRDHCLAVFLSPLSPSPHNLRSKVQSLMSLAPSGRHEQPEATRIIDLTQSEEEILAQMHPKGRYNIHVAQKSGIHVEESRDIDAFHSLLLQTAERDGFQILPLRTYKAFLERFPGSFLLLALSSHRPIAGLLGVTWGQMGLYYYGASDYASRSLMAPYALQWEAMRMCKAKGCTTYDLLGIAPPSVTLRCEPHEPRRATKCHGSWLSCCLAPHHDTAQQHHPWAGVSAFKEKFGGTIVTYPPEQQIMLRPWLWKMLQWKRWIVG